MTVPGAWQSSSPEHFQTKTCLLAALCPAALGLRQCAMPQPSACAHPPGSSSSHAGPSRPLTGCLTWTRPRLCAHTLLTWTRSDGHCPETPSGTSVRHLSPCRLPLLPGDIPLAPTERCVKGAEHRGQIVFTQKIKLRVKLQNTEANQIPGKQRLHVRRCEGPWSSGW